MEIAGSNIAAIDPASPPSEPSRGDSSGETVLASYGDPMYTHNSGLDAGGSNFSNESSAMSTSTEAHGATQDSLVQPSSLDFTTSASTNDAHMNQAMQNEMMVDSVSSAPAQPASEVPIPQIVHSSSILSHMPPVTDAHEHHNLNGNFTTAATPLVPPASVTSSSSTLSASAALSTSVGGTMLSTSIGKKIKIMAKKPDPIPAPAPEPVAAPEIQYAAPPMYQMEVDEAYDATGAAYGYNYGLADPTNRTKRKGTGYVESYDLTASMEGPPAKKRAGKVSGSRGPRAIDASYSPSPTGANGGKLRNSGMLTASGNIGTPRGASKMKNSDVYVTPAPTRRQPPVGMVSSRRELNGTAMAVCYDVVAEMMALPEASPFNQPVNPEALGIPEYFTIITNPMDLSTVKDKVKRHRYVNLREFLDDVRLIWSNATLFNGADSPVHQMALTLAEYFEQRIPHLTAQTAAVEPHFAYATAASSYASADTKGDAWGTPMSAGATTRYAGPVATTPRNGRGTPKGPARPQRAAAQYDPTRAQYEERIKVLTASLKSAENQLTNLKKNGYNQALNRAIDALAAKVPPRTFEVPDVTPMPYELKASLAHVLRTMTDETHVRKIVSILMEEHYPFPRHGPEAPLNLDEMEPVALRRLEHYVRTEYPDGPTLLATPAPEEPLQLPAPIAVPRKFGGSTVVTSAASTDESMHVDVMGFDPVPAPSAPQTQAMATTANMATSTSMNATTKHAPTNHGSTHPTKHVPKHHALLDESDSDTSDSDSDEDDVNSTLLLRSSTRVLDIVPTTAAPPKEVEIKNIQSWTNFDATTAAANTKSPARPMTPGSATTTPGGILSNEAESTDGEGTQTGDATNTPAWENFRAMDAQNKQRDRERQELAEKQKKEKEERELELKMEEERKRLAALEAEAAAQRALEEEKIRREAELKARREAERAQREAASENPGIDMMAQNALMRDMEKQIRHGS